MRKNSIHFYLYGPAAVISVAGEDSFSFLQGQFTNDLRQPVGSSTYGLWLNQKGKTLADSYILRIGENNFLVVSIASAAAVIQQRLEQYIIADDVTLEDKTAEFRGLAIWGEGCGEALKRFLGATPGSGKFVHGSVNACWSFPGRRSSVENYEIITTESISAEWCKQLVAEGVEVTGNGAEAVRISSYIPSIPTDIGPTDLPNEAGLETNALSFTKGCYLGQEVMARLKNLGQVRRHLRRLRGRGVPPAIGAAVFQGGKKVGEIRSAASTGEEFVALAMLTRLGLDESLSLDCQATTGVVQKASLWRS